MARFNLREYARQGAQARAAELTAELAEIYRAFPDLRSARLGIGGRVSGPQSALKRARRRKPMSAAQKKAVSVRMKKYWAGRRKANA